MIESAGSRLLLARTALAAGAFGELFSPYLFLYGAGVDGVIVFQILFFGLFLLGLYITSDEILRKRGVTQPPSVPVPESASAETPGASAEEFQARLDQNLWARAMYVTTLVVGLLGILLLSADLDFTIYMLANSSLATGTYCAVSTPYLRMGMVSHNRTMVAVSSVLLVVLTLLWVPAQRIAYVLFPEDLTPSDYASLVRLSSVTLLASASLGLLGLGLVIYFSRRRVLGLKSPH